jgi:Domain of unknown function (DUF4190)
VTSPPEQPFRAVEYPPLEQSPNPPGAPRPVDYPENYPPLPPPVYPQPGPGYPGGYPGYPGGYPSYPGDPYDPYRTTRPPGTNGMATAALVTSLVGLLFCGLPSVFGLILGIVALRDIKRTGQEGNGLAVAGVIIGAIATAGWLVLVFFWILGAVLAASDATLV